MFTFDNIPLMRAALLATANGIVITNTKGDIVWINPSFEVMSGYTFSEIVNQNIRILKSGQHTKEFYLNMWATISSGKTWTGEIINRRKDGTLYIDMQTITPIATDDGSITHFVAVKQDITVQRAHEKEAEEELSMLHAIFNYSLDAILLTVPDGQIVKANWAACKLFQREEQELITLGAASVLDTTDPNLKKAIEERARTGKYKGVLRFVRKDGTKFFGELYSNVFVHENEQRTSMIIRELDHGK